MKKILILGGYTHMNDVVKTANRMGLYTIVTDREPDAPAKSFADKSYNISTDDIESLVNMAEKEKIDGVFNAFDDFNTWQAQALCERLGLPHYATKEQLEICSNKDRFKDFCRSFGVPVIEEYNIDELVYASDGRTIEFPVIVKPVDSYASQGITVCYGKEELEKAYEKARQRSKTGKVIVERFIDNSHGVEMYYTVKGGKVVLTAVTDRYVQKLSDEHPPLPTATIFPSQHLDHYLAVLDAKVRNMIRGMGIENGVLFIQSLIEKERFYLYEMGFRLSGEQHYQIIEKQTGINLLKMMLDFTIGGELNAYSIAQFDNGYSKIPACNLAILLNEGTVKDIIGLERILAMPEVLSFIQLKERGDNVEASGNYGQMLGRFNIVSENLHQTLETINNTLKVISTDGRNLIASGQESFLLPA
ncbi:biotin carboxylase [Planomicrobium soli]|uniref:Biotin carboxylase n=1 Tax=Planomicrobium soli TaxID=1176648 RepID=A0A2P8H6K1_9BACL|nr:ATP-grasp domain-containing protein [Planomicrobium soli]PSL41833.1 biotin carboxylase [Planomicrobium soli]